ncbi:lytic murein transglycosylase B [Cocleimonas flava]|uniref:Membrane-bound lytic murein transglycosylase B n=1 Tax=Cocleimonas flava TaxID=634765 RepID=A0A4R1EVX2_9GAMM|nr:lytic murein transglycosylase B [Cocleimonas flava]TCJ83268.1 membrane-bound lytic murein transglycosylase B [Cocleimonas flava]
MFKKFTQSLMFSAALVLPSLLAPPYFAAEIKGNANYTSYPAMQQLIERMVQKGFDRNYLHQIFSRVQRDERILELVSSPAEGKPWHKYRPIFITEDRINSGVNFWKRHEKAITAASKQYGVDPEYIVAIIGVETFYGRNTGKHKVLRSLTTLAMDFPPREKFYTSELEHYLELMKEEGIRDPNILTGSYAGAMGLGQFISSSYRNFAVDFNQDGHTDLWHPEDAIGSVANYFSRHGWKSNGNVTVPARILGNLYAKIVNTKAIKPAHTMQILQQHGVEPLGNFSSEKVSLLQLQGLQGYEYWITGDNFYAITRYNHSPKYAMAIFQLAWEIKRRKLNSAK